MTALAPTNTKIPIPPTATKEFIETPDILVTTMVDGVLYVKLPEWIKKAGNEAILLWNSSGVELVNSETGEKTFFSINQEIKHAYWKDAMHIEILIGKYCSDPTIEISELSLVDGLLVTYKTQDRPDLDPNCYEEYKAGAVRFNWDDPEQPVIVVDQVTGKMTFLTDPNDGITDAGLYISPDGKYAAVGQITGEYVRSDLWLPPSYDQISLYRIADGALIFQESTDRDYYSIDFFPDSKTLLYFGENIPCVVDIASAIKMCIIEIPQMYPKGMIYPGVPSHDSSKFGFIYSPDVSGVGKLCFYTMDTKSVDCPTEKFSDLNGYRIVNYSLSPNEKYVIFVYTNKGCPPPWCDNFGEIYVAVMDINGKNKFSLGDFDDVTGFIWKSYFTSSDTTGNLDSSWRPVGG
jgi:hypothetical protein